MFRQPITMYQPLIRAYRHTTMHPDSANPNAHRSLPQELMDYIIDFLHKDSTTLVACTQVHRSVGGSLRRLKLNVSCWSEPIGGL